MRHGWKVLKTCIIVHRCVLVLGRGICTPAHLSALDVYKSFKFLKFVATAMLKAFFICFSNAKFKAKKIAKKVGEDSHFGNNAIRQ